MKLKINKKRINRKGDISLWILAIGVTIFAISLIMYMNKMEDKLGDIGESTIKILNNFESTERLFFYMDASIELAAKSAEQKVLENSGYASEKYKGLEVKSKCGKLNYPIIDASKNIDECFPDYEQVIKTKFTREMNVLFLQYDPFEIDPSMFSTTEKKGENSMLLSVASTTNLNMPIYSYIESYYKNADKTRLASNNALVVANDEGYLTSRMYLSLTSFERDAAPTKIVIHDTGEQNVDDTYRELFTGLNNYNYVIDTGGKIFLFTPENRYTKGANCKKQESQTCLIEDIDANSISIALVNKIPANKHTDKQIESLKKLIADIAFRNSQIEITDAAIILNNEIDSSRKDPAADIKSLKATIISDAKVLYNLKTPSNKVDGSSAQQNSNDGSSNGITNNVIFDNDINKDVNNNDNVVNDVNNNVNDDDNDINVVNNNANANDDNENNELTGMASAPPSNLDELVCFPNVVTTKYFTPNCEDYVWTSGKTHPKDECYIVNKGFYEEVKCQGSGFCDGRVYYHSTIQNTKEASEPLDEGYTHGITAAGTDPQIKRTVAAKWSCSGLSKFSKLYIYWGENSDWNGYYVVEDKGSAIDTCDHLDIYVGMGKEDLANANFNSASKNSNGNDLAKVCVLDENFEMPDPDFSPNSDFVDIITGNSEVYYAHSTQINNVTKLFEETKNALSKIITSCKANTNIDEKNICINSEMEKAKTVNNLKLEYCDNEDYKDIIYINTLPASTAPLSPTYAPKILGTISANPTIILDNNEEAEYFTADVLEPTNEQTQSYVVSSLIPIQDKPPIAASIKIKDSTGEITINLTKSALEWVNFSNKESFLYTEGLMLKKGDTILVSLNHDYANQVYYADEFSDIIPEPEDVAHSELLSIVKKLGECSSSGFSCDCEIEPTRVLKKIKIENGTIENMETGEKMLTDFFVTMTHEVDVSSGATFIVIGNYISIRFPTTTTTFPICAPNAEYKYICSTLIGDESLGTIGYALKI